MRKLVVLARITVSGALTTLCLVAVSAAGGAGSAVGAPSFSPGPRLPVGTEPSAVAVGDFNGDGSSDLAVTNTRNLRILLNDGAGRFHMAPGSPFKVGMDPSSIAVVDFNGDGRLDIAVTSDSLRILLGDGAGRFGEAPGSPLQLGGPVVAVDVNGDGSPDLLAGLRILLNDGSGRFTVLPAVPPVTSGPLAVADFNGDAKVDLAVGGSKKIAILLGDGTGAFGPARRFSVGTKVAGNIVVGDFNRDGKLDLAVSVRSGTSGDAIAVLLGTGDGGFRRAARSPSGGTLSAVADIDGDGDADLVSTDYAGVAVSLGNGAGGFRPAPMSPVPALWAQLVAVGDFNGDAKHDLLAVGGGIPVSPVALPQDVVLFQTPSEPRVEQGRRLSARADAIFSTRRIRVLAADENRAAACTNKRLVVWTAPGRKSKNFIAECYYDLALGGGRVAWVRYFAWPNEPELTTRVYSHRLSGGPLEKLGRAVNYSNHGDLSGGWLGQLLGSGPLLAFNDWSIDCLLPPGHDEENEECERENPTLRILGQDLVIAAGHSRRVRHGATFYPLRAVGGGRLAVEPAGAVVVLAPNGSRLAAVPAVDADPPRGIALSRTRLAVLRTSTLDLYAPVGGAKQAAFPLGQAAALRLAGVGSKVALLRGRHELVLVRLRDGRLVSYPLGRAAAKRLVDAKLTTAGLFYAYNLRRRAKPGRIVFEPTSRLLARF